MSSPLASEVEEPLIATAVPVEPTVEAEVMEVTDHDDQQHRAPVAVAPPLPRGGSSDPPANEKGEEINAKNTLQSRSTIAANRQQRQGRPANEEVNQEARNGAPDIDAKNTVGTLKPVVDGEEEDGLAAAANNSSKRSDAIGEPARQSQSVTTPLGHPSQQSASGEQPASILSAVFVPDTSAGIWFCRVSLVLIVLAAIVTGAVIATSRDDGSGASEIRAPEDEALSGDMAPVPSSPAVVVDSPVSAPNDVPIGIPVMPAATPVMAPTPTAPASQVNNPFAAPVPATLLTSEPTAVPAPTSRAPTPQPVPTAPVSTRCFNDKIELIDAVRLYMEDNSEGTALSNTYGWPINSWCVSNVQDFSYLFASSSFNEPIGDWDTSKARTMAGMFSSNPMFDQPLRFNTTLVTDMRSMFYRATAFNQALPFNTQNVESLASTFDGATAFNGDLSNWDVSSVTTMSQSFRGAGAFRGDLSNWDVSKVTTMSYGESINIVCQ